MRRAGFVALVAALLPLAAVAAEDGRQFVAMPAEARAELRAEMIDFQAALHQIVAALGEGRHGDAADAAEKQIGVSAMGRHRHAAPNARPGMHMPAEMHAIARGMHVSASEFAKAARAGDVAKSLQSLQTVTGACVSCHRAYRTQ